MMRRYDFITKVHGRVRIRARTYDEALEGFLKLGHQATDIEDVQ